MQSIDDDMLTINSDADRLDKSKSIEHGVRFLRAARAMSAASGPPAKEEVKIVKLSFLEDFMLSGVAAVTSKTVAAPIERLKMVKQNESELVRKGVIERPFSSLVECTRWILANEGVKSSRSGGSSRSDDPE